MSWLKFGFFLYVLFDFYNEINLQGLTPITGWKTAWVSHAEKRKGHVSKILSERNILYIEGG
jgi:hypothetical protein